MGIGAADLRGIGRAEEQRAHVLITAAMRRCTQLDSGAA